MIKLIGAVLVLVSAYAIGSLLALKVKEQEKWLKDMNKHFHKGYTLSK